MSNSDLKNNEFTFKWRIDNFLFCCLKNGETLTSPTFVAKTLAETQWYLKLFPRGSRSRKHVACYLLRENLEGEVDEIDVKYKIELINNSIILESRQSDVATFQKSRGRGWMEFMGIDDVSENIRSSGDDSLTVKCYMIEIKPKPASSCNGLTKIVTKRYFFKWCMKLTPQLTNESLKFHCCEEWQIAITSSDPDDNVYITIRKIKKDTTRVVRCVLSLLDIYGCQIKSKKSEHFFESNMEDTWIFPEFLKKSELIDEKFKYLKNSVLTLKCEFFVSSDTVFDEIEGYEDEDLVMAHPAFIDDSCVALHDDLQRMYLNHIQTDIKLQCENESFQAHKSILSVRSPVFATNMDMLENQAGVVDILDMQATTLDSFLRFVYSGVVKDMDLEKASKLLAVAEKYQMVSLKEKCTSFLKSILTTENVCGVLVAAYMGREEDLMSAVVDFITTHAETILHSVAWYQCVKENAILATEILCKVSAKLGDSRKCSK